jgi:hypothetical protein
MSFLKQALEASEKAFNAAHGAVEEWNEHRRASNLMLKLGIAVYAEQRLGGSHDAVERILSAIDGHAAEYQEVGIDHLRAAHEVLGEEFVSAHPHGLAAPPAAEASATTAPVPAQPEATPGS